MVKKTAIISLVLILLFINWSILGKEKHLAEGSIIYLDLVPVDPRSLMQGDYMALRFRIANEIYKALPKEDRKHNLKLFPADGYVVASLDAQKVGSFSHLYNNQELSSNEIRLKYRVRNGTVKLATNAYFFQEGHGKYYQTARYGQFRVDKKGELLLVAMHDEKLMQLKPNKND